MPAEKTHIEGYWAYQLGDDSGFPFPSPSQEDWNKEGFLKRLDTLEKKAQIDHMKGFSMCRLCHCVNGTREFYFEHEGTEYRWPAGFRHYVADHDVRPTPQFEKIVFAVTEPGFDLQNTDAIHTSPGHSSTEQRTGRDFGFDLPADFGVRILSTGPTRSLPEQREGRRPRLDSPYSAGTGRLIPKG